MYQRIRGFIETYADRIAILLAGGVIILWLLSRFIPSLSAWVRSEGLLNVIILLLVAEVWALVVGLKAGGPHQMFQLFSNQSEASADLVKYILETRPSQCRLVEFSAATVETVLQALVKVNCEISLLVQHPDAAINSFQKTRIKQRLVEMNDLHFKEYPRVNIRLYSVPGALRGRLIGEDLVSVGWYTYSNDNVGVYGHDNPVLNIRTHTPEGVRLKHMMERGFKFLWDHEKTITMENYYETLSK